MWTRDHRRLSVPGRRPNRGITMTTPSDALVPAARAHKSIGSPRTQSGERVGQSATPAVWTSTSKSLDHINVAEATTRPTCHTVVYALKLRALLTWRKHCQIRNEHKAFYRGTKGLTCMSCYATTKTSFVSSSAPWWMRIYANTFTARSTLCITGCSAPTAAHIAPEARPGSQRIDRARSTSRPRSAQPTRTERSSRHSLQPTRAPTRP